MATKNYPSVFTERLNILFENGNIASKDAVEATGISKGYLSQLRSGAVTNPGIDIVSKLADFFGVSPAYFFGTDDDIVSEVAKYLKCEDEMVREIIHHTRPLTPKAKRVAVKMFLDMVKHVREVEDEIMDRGSLVDLD